MTDLLAARSQMAMSLGFHMIFATFGIGLPALLVIAEALFLRTGDRGWRRLGAFRSGPTPCLRPHRPRCGAGRGHPSALGVLAFGAPPLLLAYGWPLHVFGKEALPGR